jgi:ABC-type amino acid transport substrate-binding protein
VPVADNSLNDVVKSGKLQVAVLTDDLPFSSIDAKTGQSQGGEIELANLLAEKLNVTASFQKVATANSLIPSLTGDQSDVIIDGLTPTTSRKAQIDFSDSYFTTGQVIITRSDDKTITNTASLNGKKLGVLAGSTSETYAKSLKTGTSGPTIQLYDTQSKYFADLQSKTIDAVVSDAASGNWYVKQTKGLKTVGNTLTREDFAVGVRKDDTALKNAVNRAIVAVKADPRYATIIKKWYQ